MKKTNSRLMVAALLPRENAAAIEFVQKQYETKGWHITQEPHVTLVRPGTALQDESAALQFFSDMSLSSPQPRIRAMSIRAFLNATNANVVYLRVEPNAQLTALHNILRDKLAEFIEDNQAVDNFVPHVTLANNIADEQTVDQIIDEVSNEKLQLDFVLTEVHLFRKSDTDPRWVWLAQKSIG